MNRAEFFALVQRNIDPKEWERIQVAYWFAKEVHRSQSRDNGERYFEHCRRASLNILQYSERSHDADAVIIALLHDTVEDCFVPEEVIRLMLHKYVAEAVEVLSKAIPIFDKGTGAVIRKEKKSLTQYYAGIESADSRIASVKLADRLDNLSDMAGWPDARKAKYLAETEKYIVPLCGKDRGLGLRLLQLVISLKTPSDVLVRPIEKAAI